MSPFDYAILVAYLIGITAIGLFVSREKQTTLDQYFLGNRAVPWLITTASIVATGVSCKSLVGLPGLSFKTDMTFLQIYLPMPLAVFISTRVFLPFYARLRVTSVHEYLSLRFNSRLRSFTSLLCQLETALLAGTVIAAPSLVLSAITGLSYNWAVVILLFLTLFYTALGGTKAIIWTDMAQLAVFTGVPVAILIYLNRHADGGLPELFRIAGEHGKLRVLDFSFSPKGEVTIWAALFSMTLWHLAGSSVDQFNVQRFLTAPSERDCRRSMMLGSVGVVILWTVLMSIGVILYAYNLQRPGTIPSTDTADRVFPAFVLSALPAGFKGLFISAAFAAAMSHLSSMLNALGTLSLLDIWKLHRDDGASPTTWIRRARTLTVLWGFVAFGAAFVVLNFGTVVTAGIKLGTVIIVSVFGVFLLGIFTQRATAVGAAVGAVSGMLALACILAFTTVSWTWNCLIGTVITFIVGYTVSLFSPAPQGVRPYTFVGLRESRELKR